MKGEEEIGSGQAQSSQLCHLLKVFVVESRGAPTEHHSKPFNTSSVQCPDDTEQQQPQHFLFP